MENKDKQIEQLKIQCEELKSQLGELQAKDREICTELEAREIELNDSRSAYNRLEMEYEREYNSLIDEINEIRHGVGLLCKERHYKHFGMHKRAAEIKNNLRSWTQ